MKDRKELLSELKDLYDINHHLDMAISFCYTEEKIARDILVLIEQVRDKIVELEKHLDII